MSTQRTKETKASLPIIVQILGPWRVTILRFQFIMPGFAILSCILVYVYAKEWLNDFLSYGSWDAFKDKIPMWLFLILTLVMTILSFMKNLSLIPVLGLIFCFYMMAQIPLSSWFGFAIWLVIGLVIYFSFGIKHSKLNTAR